METKKKDEAGYTEKEIKFADGEGTQLNEETEKLEGDEDEEVPGDEQD